MPPVKPCLALLPIAIAALATATLASVPSASAAPMIAGSFTGIATIEQTIFVNGMFTSPVSMVPASGTFSASVGHCAYEFDPTHGTCISSSSTGSLSPQVSLTLNVNRLSLLYASTSDISVATTSTGQALTLDPTFSDPYYNASITLSGPANAFTNGLDLTTLHPGPVDPALSSVQFADGRDLVGTVRLTDVQLVGIPSTAVPEPLAGGLAMLPAALLTAASLRRRNRSAAIA